MMLNRENNEHSEDSASMQKSMMLSGERRKRTIFGSVCSDSFDDLRGINGAKANSLGPLLYVGVSSY